MHLWSGLGLHLGGHGATYGRGRASNDLARLEELRLTLRQALGRGPADGEGSKRLSCMCCVARPAPELGREARARIMSGIASRREKKHTERAGEIRRAICPLDGIAREGECSSWLSRPELSFAGTAIRLHHPPTCPRARLTPG